MLIVDSQIHLWQNGKMSAQHRQIPTYSVDDALAEMASAGVDCAVIHPPSSLGEAVNVLAVEAARRHPDKFCISLVRRRGGPMARSTGSGRLARGRDCPSGSWPAATWRRWRESPSGIPV